ncbi:PRC-barrel domain-containing protein [Aurantimonas sp. VKM B-3413]|uniref:PRC-barrel domain-containing protein n=1 Tax=Aurantimonas sp. VKM B-3413 TaxID=2779401 RepID=UPI001E3E0B7E|nr:PRC-barrel domain-containing protein [Aurantimonas sp. VKM B-3413]MCB8835834.1 PRC-barrel domain-containing protein [Aurantimonas sp. VKM B-3413]
MFKTTTALAFAGTLLATFAAQAQGSNDKTPGISLDGVSGFSAEGLLQQDVAGQDGQPIGEVINFEIADNGSITRVIINSDGFLGVDETVIAVPFSAIDLTPQMPGIRADIEEDDTDSYSIFGPNKADAAKKSSYRVSALLGDDVKLKHGSDYGYLTDLAFDQQGHVKAVVVQPDVAFGASGYYAFPFDGDTVAGSTVNPYAATLSLPYDSDGIRKAVSIDYEGFRDGGVLGS